MDKKWLWLVLFLLFAGFGTYKWFFGGSSPDRTQEIGDPSEEVVQDPDMPVMGSGKNQVAPPPVPGARRDQGGFEARPPVVDSIEPPGFEPRMQPQDNSFAPPSANSPPPTQPMPGDPPDSAFSPVPPSSFENPGFVTPPSPPPQMDNEAVPFDEDPPPPPPGQFEELVPQDGSGGSGDMPEDFSPPIED